MEIHSFSACDSINDFSKKRKFKALNLMWKKEEYVQAFFQLRKCITLSSTLIHDLEQLFSDIYNKPWLVINKMKQLQCSFYCQSGYQIQIFMLPTYLNVLLQRNQHSNYETSNWHQSLPLAININVPGNKWKAKPNLMIYVDMHTINILSRFEINPEKFQTNKT